MAAQHVSVVMAAWILGACGDSIRARPDAGQDLGPDAGAIDAQPAIDAGPPPCTPGVRTCAGDVLSECSSSRVPVDLETCSLGCFPDGTRCYQLDPSAYLGGMLELAATRPMLLLAFVTVDTNTGRIEDRDGGELSFPSELLPGPPAIRVFAASGIQLVDVDIAGDHAVAFVSHGAVAMSGRVSVRPTGQRRAGCSAGVGDDGLPLEAGVVADGRFPGGGGGAHRSPGGRGGNNPPGLGGGGGQTIADDGALVGGCSGGDVLERQGDGSLRVHAAGGLGGSAIHFLSDTSIAMQLTAGKLSVWLDARGGEGTGAGAGGGGGGRIVLEAPTVILGPPTGRATVAIDAGGGHGRGGTAPGGVRGGVPPPGDGGSLAGDVPGSQAGGGGGACGRLIVMSRTAAPLDGSLVPRPELRIIGRR